jgi:hypothetical protein
MIQRDSSPLKRLLARGACILAIFPPILIVVVWSANVQEPLAIRLWSNPNFRVGIEVDRTTFSLFFAKEINKKASAHQFEIWQSNRMLYVEHRRFGFRYLRGVFVNHGGLGQDGTNALIAARAAIEIGIPSVLAILLCLLCPIWYLRRYPSENRRQTANRCRDCGYSLIGNVSGICPECGAKLAR